MNKIKDLFARFKKIKHFEILLAVIVGLVVCVVYFSFFTKPKTDKTNENLTDDCVSAMEYVDFLENKLSNVLSKISGVGDVNVIITLESGFSYEYASDTETKSTTSGGVETTITTQTIILVSNEPVVVKEIYPIVKGVVVVAEGAENFNIKMNILTAVETVLEVERNNITILA